MTGPRRKMLLALAASTLLALALLPPLAEHWSGLMLWIDAHQRLAWISFVASYVLAAVLALPASLLTLAAGLLFGLRLGSVLVFVGSVAGAAAAFLAGRFIARDWVAAQLARSPRYRALDLATRSRGFLIVLLARLSPLIPFNILNYGLSVTAVRFRHYFAATVLGMPPVIVLYVYLGTLAKSLTELAMGPSAHPQTERLAFGGGLVLTIVVSVLIARITTRALTAELEQAAAGGEEVPR